MSYDPHGRRHRWANIVVITAGIYALLAAVWSPPELYTPAGADDVGVPGWLYLSYIAGGVLALSAVFISLKIPVVGKILAALAGLALFTGFIALRDFSLVALASLGLSGLALLGTAPFMGRMPTPEDEGMERTGWGNPDEEAERRANM